MAYGHELPSKLLWLGLPVREGDNDRKHLRRRQRKPGIKCIVAVLLSGQVFLMKNNKKLLLP